MRSVGEPLPNIMGLTGLTGLYILGSYRAWLLCNCVDREICELSWSTGYVISCHPEPVVSVERNYSFTLLYTVSKKSDHVGIVW